MKRLLVPLLAALALPIAVKSDVWIAKNGETAIVIKENGQISFFDTGHFYYYNQIFENVRKNKTQLTVCVGFQKQGMPQDCLSNLPTNYSIHNQGETRALHINLSNYPFLRSSFEEQLRLGKIMNISIDDGDLSYYFTLNKEFKLKDVSMRIFKLSD